MRLVVWLVLAGCAGDTTFAKYNQAPAVKIVDPIDGQALPESDAITFLGNVSDDTTEPHKLEIMWSSDLDGQLSTDSVADSDGVVTYTSGALTVGTHTIILAATDKDDEYAEHRISVTITDVPDAPEISVVHPIGGEYAFEDEEFEFSAQLFDNQDRISALSFTVTSDKLAEPVCTGTADAAGLGKCRATIPLVDDHRLTFTVEDSSGLAAYEEVVFPILSVRTRDDDGDGFNEDQGDCDDNNLAAYPAAEELYNSFDDDCDGVTDEETVNYDDDFDGQRELDGDCDDTDPYTYLGAVESCDGRDNDCDFVIDEDTQCSDDDGDGYTEIEGDCDDAYAATYPLAAEVEDSHDNDCDVLVDEGTTVYDDDGDGFSEVAGDCNDTDITIAPSATEVCDGYDNDCSGSADDEGATGCYTYYYDYDGDGYGSASASGSCLCAPDGYYTASYNSDCYDYNSSASPAQTFYQSSQRGDGSFDWNCDGVESKYYTVSHDCGWDCSLLSSGTQGWLSGTPGCGTTSDWVTSCSLDWFTCTQSTTPLTQTCL